MNTPESRETVIVKNIKEIAKLGKEKFICTGITPVFFLDLDATLIEGSVDVSFRTERKLEDFVNENQADILEFQNYLRYFKKEFGAKFLITTGRDPKFSKKAWEALTGGDKDLEINGAIFENGALLTTNGWNNIRPAKQLSPEAILNLLNSEKRITINKYVTETLGGGIEDKSLVLTYNNPRISAKSSQYESCLKESRELLSSLKEKYPLTDEKIIHTQDWINKLEENHQVDKDKFEEMPSDTFNALLAKKVEELNIKGVYVLTSGAHSMEILPKGVNKATTINELLHDLTKPSKKEENEKKAPSYMFFAFGDSTNDLDLMKKSPTIPASPSNAKVDVITFVNQSHGYSAPERELKGSLTNLKNISQDLERLKLVLQ